MLLLANSVLLFCDIWYVGFKFSQWRQSLWKGRQNHGFQFFAISQAERLLFPSNLSRPLLGTPGGGGRQWSSKSWGLFRFLKGKSRSWFLIWNYNPIFGSKVGLSLAAMRSPWFSRCFNVRNGSWNPWHRFCKQRSKNPILESSKFCFWRLSPWFISTWCKGGLSRWSLVLFMETFCELCGYLICHLEASICRS